MRNVLAAALLPLALAGCTIADVVTLPVKAASTAVGAAGSAVDAVTTSQAEADRKRGARIRKQEECMGREQKRADRKGRTPDYSRCER
jgi:hypothetical protein